MLTDPYGALVKDCCLIACAITVWMLAPAKYGNPYPEDDKISRNLYSVRGFITVI
jgi:hypothetical protein